MAFQSLLLTQENVFLIFHISPSKHVQYQSVTSESISHLRLLYQRQKMSNLIHKFVTFWYKIKRCGTTFIVVRNIWLHNNVTSRRYRTSERSFCSFFAVFSHFFAVFSPFLQKNSLPSRCAPIDVDENDTHLKKCISFTRSQRSVRLDCKPGPSEQVTIWLEFWPRACSLSVVLRMSFFVVAVDLIFKDSDYFANLVESWQKWTFVYVEYFFFLLV